MTVLSETTASETYASSLQSAIGALHRLFSGMHNMLALIHISTDENTARGRRPHLLVYLYLRLLVYCAMPCCPSVARCPGARDGALGCSLCFFLFFICAHAALSLRKWFGVAIVTQKVVRNSPYQP